MLIAIILDVLLLALVGGSVFLAYRKGLIKTLFSLVGAVAAVALAVLLCNPVAAWLDDQFVNPAVRKTVLTAINGSSVVESYDEALAATDVVGTISKMPDKLRDFLEKMNVDVDSLVDVAEQSGAASLAAKERLIGSIANPVSEGISKMVALLGLFVIFFVLLFIVSRFLDAVFSVLPFAKSLNRSGGVIFGIVRALLLALIYSSLVYLMAKGSILITLDHVEDTYLLDFLNQYNPILKYLA